jgi:hypothetical protein
MTVPFSVGMPAVSMVSLMPTVQAVERPDGAAGGVLRVERPRLPEREIAVEPGPGLDLGLTLGDAREAGLGERDGAQLAPGQPVAQLDGAEREHGPHQRERSGRG